MTQQSSETAVRPFDVPVFPDSDLEDLRRRIKATRWPDRETVDDITQGTQLATIQRLAHYWSTEYDWRRCEEKVKALPHFVTEIDGLDIHFVHVRSKHENALPILVTHGWPGSFLEQLKIIDPLTNPTAHGASASDAFDVVIPSMPGYGFSGKPTSPGWDVPRIARAWTGLMRRLGYEKFVAQGGDWGAVVTDVLAAQAPPGLLGIHVNMPGVVTEEISKAALGGAPPPDGLPDDERQAWEHLGQVGKHLGYAIMFGTRPQSLTALADSPVGMAAFMIDHDDWSNELIARVFEGRPEGLTRDDVLDNATLYWLTNTSLSAGRLYRENKLPFFSPKNVTLPVAVSAFPDELYQSPRSWAERAYPNLVFFRKRDKGGHFAAWEQPKALTEDIREGLRSVRTTAR